jgi:c-di-GMP-binding flagellar brake protein YcgR
MSGRLKYKPENEQYRAEFPLEVLYLQRRTAYRVLIPPAHQILIKIKMDDEQGDLIGRLLDLSSSGFKVQFEGDAKARLEKQKQFPVARVRFNRENTIDCSLEARHVVINDQGDTQCGFAFTLLSPAAQRYLDRLITEFQWEERQIKRQQEQDFPPL